MGVFFYPQTGNQLSQEHHDRFRWFFFSILCIKGWCFQKSKFWCVTTEAWPWNSRSRTFSKQFSHNSSDLKSWVSYRYDFWANMHVILLMELKWTKIHTEVFKRDPVRQGHVTLSRWAWPFLTLVLVTLERWSFFCFAGFRGDGCQININPHCNYQAWPCMTRSRDPERDLS